MNTNGDINVYFNSACPICKAGIEAQKNKKSTCDIVWNDLHLENSLSEKLGRELALARKYLHATDDRGERHVGVDAFILLWENSPQDNWKAKLLSLPVIKEFSQAGYFIFANLLYGFNIAMKNW